MATRSRIALQLTDDSFLSVYHHWDGYPEWLGFTLNKKFNTRDKVAELIDGGDMSSCDSDSVYDYEKQAFVKRDPKPEYYNDTRGEKTEPRLDLSFEDYVEKNEEYAYVYTLDHEWECFKLYGDKPVKVTIPADYPQR